MKLALSTNDNISKNQLKKINKYIIGLEKHISMRKANSFFHLLTKTCGYNPVRIKYSEKEEKIKNARKLMLKAKETYENLLKDSATAIRGGSTVADSWARHQEIPGIVIQMVKVGEETGELGKILTTLAKFYNREVVNAVDTLVGLIEPIMIVALGLGVGVLLAAVLIPIYNLAGAI